MKNVLILAVNFPPTGGVGVIRSLKYVKYLPEFGWNPIVITVPEKSKKIVDHSMINEISQDIEVHRPSFINYKKIFPGDFVKLFKPIEKRLSFPDRFVQWNYFAFKYIKKHIIPKQMPDLIYTSTGPHSTIMLAHKLKRHFGIPFVLDFRDPFSFSQYAILDTRDKWRQRARDIEREVFADADRIINVSSIWQKKYEELYPFIKPKSSLIHNGYDEDDFKNLMPEKIKAPFTVGYNGTFSRVVPIDPLIKAIIEIHRKKNIRVRLRIATPIAVKKIKSSYPYLFENDLIDYKGFLPHRESLSNLMACHAAILILNDIPATKGMIPAKTFEYLRINRPILLLHKKGGHLEKLLSQTQTGFAVDINDRQQIINSLLKLYNDWKTGTKSYKPRLDKIKTYERKYLTGKLAAVFDAICFE